ncbi:MAG: hypothetical protein CME70_06340 [Halobacteriovorax sp.]|nr:hypothetical protein [Halobacteriovorax sp.]|tara:strand:- start:777 stop:1697 length:921 start_codon:yes stop_codon:yes gene_type:complete
MGYAAYEQSDNYDDGLAAAYDAFHLDVTDAYDAAMQNADNTAGLSVLEQLANDLGLAIDQFLMSSKLDLVVTWETETCSASGANDETTSSACKGHVVHDSGLLSTLQEDIFNAKKTNLHDKGEAGEQDAVANITSFATELAGYIHTYTKDHAIVTKSDTTAGTSAPGSGNSGGSIATDGEGDGEGEGGTATGLTAGADSDLDAAIKDAYIEAMEAGAAPSGSYADLSNPDATDSDKLSLAKDEIVNKILAKGVCDGIRAYFESVTVITTDEKTDGRTVSGNSNVSSGATVPSETDGCSGSGTGTLS